MYTLVKKNRINSGAESASSETFDSMEKALKRFYQLLANNVADETVVRFDIAILNSDLIPCKTEHFARETEEIKHVYD